MTQQRKKAFYMKHHTTYVGAVILLFCCLWHLSLTAQAQTTSGTCGDNLTWVLDENGTVTISGTGPMKDYTYEPITRNPWVDLSVTEIILEEGVTSIGDYAFYACYTLQKLSLPSTLESISEIYPFLLCTSLQKITVAAENQTFVNDESGVLYRKDMTKLIHYPAGSSLISYEIPATVTDIENSAFYFASTLQNITIPNGVTHIKEYTFCGCGITDITLPNSVTSIGFSAFANADALTSIFIPANVSEIGGGAFHYCDQLTTIFVDTANPSYSNDASGCLYNKDLSCLLVYPAGKTETTFEIPDTVTTIGPSAFEECNFLVTVIIPEQLTEISPAAFYGCDNLAEITLPKNVEQIGDSAFVSCKNLNKATILNCGATIEDWAFYDCKEDFALYGYSGSTAQEYAEQNELPFVPLEGTVSDKFIDIPEVSWYTPSVQYVFDRGYMTGKKGYWFDAMGTLTRAEFVTTLYSIAGKPTITNITNPFADVQNEQWYTNPILWANSIGCVSGYDNGKFGTFDNITREQLALILYKNGKEKIPNINTTILDQFPDCNEISTYANEALQWAVTNGIMAGNAGGKLNPKGKATRAECAVMLYKYCELLK